MLKVLGAGLSRTGTFSLKRALERIGFGPCYHMDEVFRRPDHVAMWGDASLREPDWRVLLDGCVSAADAPVCHFWRQIRDAYPDAKIVLTVRDSESWYESFHATVFQTMMHPTLVPAPARAPLEMARRLDRDAYGQVERTLGDPQSQLPRQSDDLAFYRSIVSPADGIQGLRKFVQCRMYLLT